MDESTLEIADSDITDESSLPLTPRNLTAKQIEELYSAGRFRVIQDRTDFMLPQIEDYVRTKKWLNVKPEYQRRLRWDDNKKSLLIESFLMNVPVPSIFLYEGEINRYEVMDGQQRLNAIMDFYSNRLRLRGLKVWPALNGKRYSELPPIVQRGLDRAKLSAVVLISEGSTGATTVDSDIRTEVFDRLNTGGEKLNAQELRNSLFSGPFNDLIVNLAGWRPFTDVWGIPSHEENIRGEGFVSEELRKNPLFRTMGDCEIVLRFFAFRERSKIRGAVKTILDNCMRRYRYAEPDVLQELEYRFKAAFNASVEIFGDMAFQIPSTRPTERSKLSRALFDAVMVSLDGLADQNLELVRFSDRIVNELRQFLSVENAHAILVGRPNTAKALKERIDSIEKILRQSANV